MKTSREPKLPGLPRTDPEDDADTGVVDLPWDEEPESPNASAFEEREKQAVAALGEPDISTTLRGAPDTVKLGAQTWKPPAGKRGGSPDKLDVQDTIKLGAQTWKPPTPSPALGDDDDEETTDVAAAKPTPVPIVGEGDAEVAGVIRADEGPARIVSSPPDDPVTPVPLEPAPRSIQVSPSAAHPRLDPSADVTPLPPPLDAREATPVPRMSEATPLPDYHETTPLPHAASRRKRPDPTTLVATRGSKSTATMIVVALISASLGLGAGYLVWGMNPTSDDAAPTTTAAPVVDDTEPPAKRGEAPAVKPQPATCKLVVNSEPDGATVRVGKANLGKTPIDAELDCSGEATVRVSKRRYVSATEKISLAAGEPVKIAVELERPTYKLAIHSIPRGAKVVVNGETAGKTPTTVSLPGFEEAKIVVSKRGYRPYKKTITPRRRRSTIKPRLRRRR